MSEEKHGLKEMNELFDALDVIAEFVGGVWADKKVSFDDIDDLVSMATKFDKLKDGFEGLSGAKNELGDLEKAEMLALLGRAWAVGEAYERGRRNG